MDPSQEDVDADVCPVTQGWGAGAGFYIICLVIGLVVAWAVHRLTRLALPWPGSWAKGPTGLGQKSLAVAPPSKAAGSKAGGTPSKASDGKAGGKAADGNAGNKPSKAAHEIAADARTMPLPLAPAAAPQHQPQPSSTSPQRNLFSADACTVAMVRQLCMGASGCAPGGPPDKQQLLMQEAMLGLVSSLQQLRQLYSTTGGEEAGDGGSDSPVKPHSSLPQPRQVPLHSTTEGEEASGPDSGALLGECGTECSTLPRTAPAAVAARAASGQSRDSLTLDSTPHPAGTAATMQANHHNTDGQSCKVTPHHDIQGSTGHTAEDILSLTEPDALLPLAQAVVRAVLQISRGTQPQLALALPTTWPDPTHLPPHLHLTALTTMVGGAGGVGPDCTTPHTAGRGSMGGTPVGRGSMGGTPDVGGTGGQKSTMPGQMDPLSSAGAHSVRSRPHSTPGSAAGVTPGSASRQAPGSATRLTPGSASRQAPGSASRLTPGSDTCSESVNGQLEFCWLLPPGLSGALSPRPATPALPASALYQRFLTEAAAGASAGAAAGALEAAAGAPALITPSDPTAPLLAPSCVGHPGLLLSPSDPSAPLLAPSFLDCSAPSDPMASTLSPSGPTTPQLPASSLATPDLPAVSGAVPAPLAAGYPTTRGSQEGAGAGPTLGTQEGAGGDLTLGTQEAAGGDPTPGSQEEAAGGSSAALEEQPGAIGHATKIRSPARQTADHATIMPQSQYPNGPHPALPRAHSHSGLPQPTNQPTAGLVPPFPLSRPPLAPGAGALTPSHGLAFITPSSRASRSSLGWEESEETLQGDSAWQAWRAQLITHSPDSPPASPPTSSNALPTPATVPHGLPTFASPMRSIEARLISSAWDNGHAWPAGEVAGAPTVMVQLDAAGSDGCADRQGDGDRAGAAGAAGAAAGCTTWQGDGERTGGVQLGGAAGLAGAAQGCIAWQAGSDTKGGADQGRQGCVCPPAPAFTTAEGWPAPLTSQTTTDGGGGGGGVGGGAVGAVVLATKHSTSKGGMLTTQQGPTQPPATLAPSAHLSSQASLDPTPQPPAHAFARARSTRSATVTPRAETARTFSETDSGATAAAVAPIQGRRSGGGGVMNALSSGRLREGLYNATGGGSARLLPVGSGEVDVLTGRSREGSGSYASVGARSMPVGGPEGEAVLLHELAVWMARATEAEQSARGAGAAAEGALQQMALLEEAMAEGHEQEAALREELRGVQAHTMQLSALLQTASKELVKSSGKALSLLRAVRGSRRRCDHHWGASGRRGDPAKRRLTFKQPQGTLGKPGQSRSRLAGSWWRVEGKPGHYSRLRRLLGWWRSSAGAALHPWHTPMQSFGGQP